MNNEEWDRCQGRLCPACGQDAFRFMGLVCSRCGETLPGKLAEKLTAMGLPATVEDGVIKAAILEHQIKLAVIKGSLYYEPAPGDRRLFRGLETELRNWAKDKGLAFQAS